MGEKFKRILRFTVAIFVVGLAAGLGVLTVKAAAPTGSTALMQNSTATTVDIVITGTDFTKFVSADATTANGTDLAKIHYNSTIPVSAVINNVTTLTATFTIATGTGKSGGSLVIDADAIKSVDPANNLTITIVTGSITDDAHPILNAVALSNAGDRNLITFTYSEIMTVADGASTSSKGDLTTAGSVAGFGAFAVAGNTTVPTTKNTVAGSGTASITITLANEAAGYLDSTSTTEPSGAFTPITGVIVVDAAANEMNVIGTPTVTGTGTWDLTKPTITSVTIADAAGNNGKIDQATVVFSAAVRDANITNADALLGGATHTGTFTTGTANDATTVFNLTADTLATDTSATAAQFTYTGATTKIIDLAGNLLDTGTDGVIGGADIVEIDGASPILTAVALGRVATTTGKNKLVFTYSEAMTVASGASTTTKGDVTTVGTVAGFGDFATNGDVTVATTKNTISGTGTTTITVVFAGESGAFLNAASSVVPSGDVTPLASAAVVDAVNNQVNTSAAAVTSTITNAWDMTKPTATAYSYTDVDFDGDVDTVTITSASITSVGAVPATDFTWVAGSLTSSAVAGASYAVVAASDAVTITLGVAGPAATTASANTTIAYTNPGDGVANHFIDDAGNQLATFGALTLGDKAQPIILTVVDQNSYNLDGGANIPVSSNIIITFSEAMITTSLDATDEWTISPDPGNWTAPAWTNSNKTATLVHSTSFTSGATETVTLTAPLAVTGVVVGDQALKAAPASAAVNNPFSFVVVGSRSSTGDTIAPTSSITAPSNGTTIETGVNYIITGTSSDAGGSSVQKVEISLNGGSSWYQATFKGYVGTGINWQYVWSTPASGIYTIKTRATDWLGNLEISGNGIVVTVSVTPTPTLTPTPTPEPSLSPTPLPGPAEPNANSGVTLYRAEGDNRVYIIKERKKEWIKSAEEFNSKGYKWSDVVITTPDVLAGYTTVLDTASVYAVDLVRAEGDNKVYIVNGYVKQWIKTVEEFNSKGFKWSNIRVVNSSAVDALPNGMISNEAAVVVKIKVVNTPSLRVRKSNTTASAILGAVKRNEIFTVLEEKSGWYKITTSGGIVGWISGVYAIKQ